MGAKENRRLLILTIFIVFICSSQCVDGLKILALFPLNGKSHWNVCEALVKALAAKGHQVDVYSHFPQKKPIPNYTDYSLVGTMFSSQNNLTYEMLSIFQSIDIGYMMDAMGNQLCEIMETPLFKELFEKVKKEKTYDLVITETFIVSCYIPWGRYLNVPTVGVMTSGLIDWYNEPLGNPVNTAVTPSIWAPLFYPMSFWERVANTMAFNSISFLIKYYTSGHSKYIEKYFGPNYPGAYEIYKDLDLLLVNTHHSIDGIRAYTPAIVPVAGMHIQDDGTPLPKVVQKWLDESKDGCIYMSFGSMVRIETFPKEVLKAFYDSFKKISPVRVLLKIAKPEDLPADLELPSNVLTQSWFPQIQVLRHNNTKGFISHGGTLSTQESLSAGIPLIGVPLYGDQSNNVKSKVRRKMAVHIDLKTIDADAIYTAINEILTDPDYKKNAEKFSKDFFDRPMSPIDTATYWVEYIARHGRGALRSPVVDLPWWQANLLDVYAFLIAALVIVCYIAKWILTKVFGLCYRFLFVDKKKKNQ